MALKVGELFASFNLDTSGLDGAVSSAEKKLSSLGKNLALGGAGMTAAVTAPIVGAAKDIYAAGSEFDAQMSKVFAIAGKSVTGNVKAMEDLRAKALEMGSTTQFTASEAGQAMEYMAMAGWKTEEMLAAVGPLMNLAAAAGEDLGTTSDIVTDAMTAFGLAADKNWMKFENGQYIDTGINNVEHFADVLAAVSSNANTNVSMLGESFKYCGAIAGTMGYSVEDTAVALGIMANSGIKASQAGTSLRRIMTSLNGDIAIEGKNLGKVTIKTANADGTMRSFSDILADCRKAFAGLTDSEKTAAAKALVGQNAMSGFLTLMNASDEELARLTGAIDDCTGAAEDMAATMLDNAKGDVTLFKSALEGLEITLWKLAEGGFRNTVQRATKLIDSFRNADVVTQAGTLRIAALAAATGPVMAGMGGIISMLPKLAGTFTAVSGPAALLAIGMIALGAAAIDSENSIGKTFVKGITKAGNKIRQTGKDVKKQLPTLTKNMSVFLDSLATGIRQGLPGIIDGLSDIVATGLSALAGNMGNAAKVSQAIVKTLADGVSRNASQIVPAVLSLLTEMAAALISNIPVVLEGMSTVITSLVKEVGNADWSEIGTKLNTAIQEALKETGTWFKKLAMGDQYRDDASWADVGTAMATNVLNGIKTAFGNVKDFVGSLLLGDNYNPEEDWATFGTKIIDKIFEGVDGAVGGASDFVGGILTGIAGMFTDDAMQKASGTLSTVAGTLIDHLFAEIPKLTDKAGSLLEKIAALILGDENSNGLAANVLDGATKLVEAIFTAIAGGMENGDGTSAVQKLLDVLGKAFSQENISRITTSLQGLIRAIFTGMTTVLPQFASQAGEVIKGIIDLMFKKNESGTSLFGSALTSVQTLVTTLIQSIISFIPQAASTATNLLSTLLDTLFAPQGEEGTEKSLVQDALESVKGLVDTILRSIPGLIQTMGSSVVSIITSLGEMLTRKDENGKYIASGIVDSLSELITQAITDLLALIPSLGESITGIIGAIGDVLLAKDDEGNYLITSLSGSLIELVKSAITTTVAAIPGIANLVSEIIGAIAGILSEKDENGNYKVTGIVDSLTQMVRDAIDTVIGLIPTLGSSAAQILTAIGAALFGTGEDEGAISQGVTALTGIVQTIFTELNTKVIPGMGTEVGKILTTIAGFFTPEKLKDLGTGLGDLAGALLTGVVDTLVATVDTLLAIGDDADTDGMFKGVLGGIEAFAGKVIEALANAIPKIVGAGGKILGRLAEIFSPENISGMITEAQNVARGLMDTIMEAFAGEKDEANKVDLFGTFAKIVSNIIDGLKDVFTPENIEKNAINVEGFVTGLIDSISTSLSDGIGTASEEGIFGKFIGLLKNLVSGIVKAIPHAFKVGEKAVTAGFQIATELLHSITEGFTDGSLDIDLGSLATAWIGSLSGILGGALDFGGEVVSAGVLLAGNLLDSLASAFDSTVSTEGVSAIGEKLGDIARKIITGITTLLPKLFDVGGKAISAGVKLATELIGSLAEGFTGTDFGGSFATMAQGLVQGIIDAVTNLPELLDGVLSAGAQIANSIMGSISSALSDAAQSGTGASLATAAADLIHGLLTSISNLGENADVKAFMENLGQGFRDAMGMLGDFIGTLIAKLLSPEGLKQIWDIGVDIAGLLLGGIGHAISGVGSFIENLLVSLFKPLTDWLDQKLREAGLLGEESLPTIKVGEQDVDLGYVQFSVDNADKAKQLLAATIASYTTDGIDSYLSDQTQRNLTSITTLAVNNQTFDLDAFVRGIWGKIATTDAKDSASGIKAVFEEKFAEIGIDISEVADDAFYEGLVGAWNGPRDFNSDVFDEAWKQLVDRLFSSDGAGEAAKEAAEESAKEAGTEAANAVVEKYTETVDEATPDAVSAVGNAASQMAKEGMATELANGTKPVQDAALKVTDAAVQQFLMTMSAENGQAIGRQFIDGIIAILDDGTLVSAAQLLGTNAYNAINAILTAGAGSTIGQNFGQGLANGIASMTSVVHTAAWNLGITAANALSAAIQEGSPSKLTTESGDNFGLGFINSILNSAENAGDAAAILGSTAAASLERTISDMQGMAVNDMSLPARSRQSEAERYAAESEHAVQRYAEAIAHALSGAQVVMDGETVGRLVMPTVSEQIAYESDLRRLGTL